MDPLLRDRWSRAIGGMSHSSRALLVVLIAFSSPCAPLPPRTPGHGGRPSTWSAFEVKGPDRKGRYKARIGMLDDGELNLGTTRTSVEMDAAQFERFTALVAATRAARDAGPAPW